MSIDDNPKLQQEIATYFAKFERQTRAIREGMNKVFGGKLDVIAYLPLEYIQERICGRPSFQIEQLKAITKVQYDTSMKEDHSKIDPEKVENQRNMEDWFWQIMEEFDTD